jgi:hypothetical protein
MKSRFLGSMLLASLCLWAASSPGASETYDFTTMSIASLQGAGWSLVSIGKISDQSLLMNATGDSIRTPAFSGNVTSVVYTVKGSATTAADFFRTKKIHTSGSDTWAASYAGGLAVNTARQTNRIAIEPGEGCRQMEFSFFKGSTGGTLSLYTLTVFYEDGGAVPNPPELLPVTEGGEGVRTLYWRASEGAESYRVSLWSVTGAPPATVSEGFDDFPATTNAGWTVAVAADSAVYTEAGFYGAAGPALRFQNASHSVATPVFLSPVTNLSFWTRCSSQSTSTLRLEASANGGDTWTEVPRSPYAVSGMAATNSFFFEKASGYTRFRISFTGLSEPFALDDITAKCAGGLGYFNILDGVSTGAATNRTATGLAGGNYRFSVVAVNANGVSAASAEGAFRIPGTPPAVSLERNNASVEIGQTLTQNVTAAMTDGDVVTAETVSAENVTGMYALKNGVFSFTPAAADIGTRVFSFTATDADGTSTPVTLTVTVSATAPGTLILVCGTR